MEKRNPELVRNGFKLAVQSMRDYLKLVNWFCSGFRKNNSPTSFKAWRDSERFEGSLSEILRIVGRN